MKIGQVSRQYHISKDNLYYYINYGLLVPPRLNNQYVFDEATLADLSWVLELKSMDYSLEEIHKILSLRRVSNLQNRQDREDLKNIYARKRTQCIEKINQYEEIVSTLDQKITDLSREDTAIAPSLGLPLRMLDLLCCPHCGLELQISDVEMDMKYIYQGNLTCSCGYHAKVRDGILITPNPNSNLQDRPDVNRELYKDLPPSLISLFQRSYNWMQEKLKHMDLKNKVVMETYVNAWFFFHNHQQSFDPSGRYIIVDKFPETLAMYKKLIEQQQYGMDILYIADSSTYLPLRKNCVDLNLDFFASNEHNFYNESFLSDSLTPYFASDASLLGTYFYFEGGHQSMKRLLAEYPECSPHNFSLPWFLDCMAKGEFLLSEQNNCGYSMDSGNNLGFSFHISGEKMYLFNYIAKVNFTKK